ncbi:MAG: hypothetical protein ACI9BD_000634, partial [Candidatus Marinamargulisbacteria bacterium]
MRLLGLSGNRTVQMAKGVQPLATRAADAFLRRGMSTGSSRSEYFRGDIGVHPVAVVDKMHLSQEAREVVKSGMLGPFSDFQYRAPVQDQLWRFVVKNVFQKP